MTRTLLLLLVASFAFGTCQTLRPRRTTPDNYYTEPHRPQLHFSPEKKWMNDPNGLVYADGEYHLFYQYYPDSTVWGPMHWGHAVSRDLFQWKHLPVALAPDEKGYIFSGSVVTDSFNTSGFKRGLNAPLVAIFTYHDMKGEQAGRLDFQSQGIAYSNDKGRTWTKYAANPVIPNPGDIKDFRDPKVMWHTATKQWVLVLAVGDHVEFYTSKDLKIWTLASRFGQGYGGPGRPWECPDLFELGVDGTSESRWVLLLSVGASAANGGSGTQYFTGQFDGNAFVSENPPDTVLWLDHGKDNYAGVTWNNAPQGRRLFIGWMSNWQYARDVPSQKWRGAMTLPRELSLRKTPAGIRLHQQPIREMQSLRQGVPKVFAPDEPFLAKTQITLPFEALVEYEIPSAVKIQSFGIQLNNLRNEAVRMGYDPVAGHVFFDRTQAGDMDFSQHFPGRHTAPYKPQNRRIRFRIVADVSSVELFVDDGAVSMTETVFPSAEMDWYSCFTAGKGMIPTVISNKVWPLRSVWNERGTSKKQDRIED